MQTKIKTTNFELTPAIESYLRKKIASIKELVEKMKGKRELWVELAKTTSHHRRGYVFKAEINIILKRRTLRAVSVKESLYNAIDEIKDEIARELKKYKGKESAKQRRAARAWKTLMRLSPSALFKGKEEREIEDEI